MISFTITLIIVVITCIVSFAAFNNEKLKEDLLFWPARIEANKQYYRFITNGLIHADFIHLFFNMFALYSFGDYIENGLFSSPDLFGQSGKMFFLVLYITALIVSPIPDYFMNRNNPAYRSLGASGAVSAVVFAGVMLHPKMGISFYFLPAIPGYIAGALFLALSAYFGRKGNSNIAHGAHFTGAVYGLLFTIVTTKLFANFDAVKAFLDAILNR